MVWWWGTVRYPGAATTLFRGNKMNVYTVVLGFTKDGLDSRRGSFCTVAPDCYYAANKVLQWVAKRYSSFRLELISVKKFDLELVQ